LPARISRLTSSCAAPSSAPPRRCASRTSKLICGCGSFTLLHEIYVQDVAAQDAEGLPAQPPRAANGALPFEHAIATLPPQQREIFLLVTLEDMSYDQVAKTLGIPIGTVMSRLSRAREKLRLLLMDQARVRVVK
jgi:RNA polymerase sigma factor (sigma-70 family)